MRDLRRLPGFRFVAVPPPLATILPRMDVAVFVGFARSGPLHTPVVVEDIARFRDIFGDDLPLAWDDERGEQCYAHLAPAVRAFFHNGGRRCWIVRVAGKAQSNIFPIPGLAQLTGGEIKPAFAQARSEGSWSDSLRIGASLSGQPVTVARVTLQGSDVELVLDSPADLAEGDLLKLTYRDEGYVLIAPIKFESASDDPQFPINSPPDRASNAQVIKSTPLWFRTGVIDSPLAAPTQAWTFTHDSETPVTVLNQPEIESDQTVLLDLAQALLTRQF